MYYKRKIGMLGEKIATDYLNNLKYQIIERNFRCRTGEIDIIAKKNNDIVFIEVKTRRTLIFGRPAEAVNYKKMKQIQNVANYFLYKNGLCDALIRFDVIEVYLMNNKYVLKHLKNVTI